MSFAESSGVSGTGHVITMEGVQVDTSNVADMLALPLPPSLRAGLLGSCGYYRKFVK